MMPRAFPGLQRRMAARYAGQGWMITFVDLLAICVAFFVLLNAMSAPKRQAWSGAARAIGERLGGTPATGVSPLQEDVVGRMHGLLRTRLGLGAPVTRLPDRVLISVPAETIMDTEGRLSAEGRRLAAQIAQTLAPIGSRIDVTGFPTSAEAAYRPMQSWRLSFGQANSFAAALAEAGYTRRIATLAGGAAGRDRRIEIAVFEDKSDEPGA